MTPDPIDDKGNTIIKKALTAALILALIIGVFVVLLRPNPTNNQIALAPAATVDLDSPTPSTTPTMSPSPTATETPTTLPSATMTASLAATFTPTETATTAPTATPTPNRYVIINELLYFNDNPPGPRVNISFRAANMPDNYRPMVVVIDPDRNRVGWPILDGAGSGTYSLAGITIGSDPAQCGQTFTVVAIMTPNDRVEGPLTTPPAGYQVRGLVVREC